MVSIVSLGIAFGGAAISGGTAAAAGKKSSAAAKKAAQQQSDYYKQGRFDVTHYNTQAGQTLNPYIDQGLMADNKLSGLLGLGPSTALPRAPGRKQYATQAEYLAAKQSWMDQVRPMLAKANIKGGDGFGALVKRADSYNQQAQQNAGNAEFGSLLRQPTLADFQASPDYQFRKEQGMEGIQQSAAAKGGLMSSGTLKALDAFNSGLASGEWGNFADRFSGRQDRTYNMLTGQAQRGQTAGMQKSNILSNTGAQLANLATGQGQNQANAAYAQGQAGANTALGIGQGIMSGIGAGYGMFENQKWMDQYKNRTDVLRNNGVVPYAGNSGAVGGDFGMG